MNDRRKALAAIVVCVLFWGFSFISIKVALRVFPPMTLGAFRFAIAVFFLFIIKKIVIPDEKLGRRDLPGLIAAGITGITLYFFFENTGVSLVTASEASIIVGAIPVLTMAAEWLGGRIAFVRARRGKNPDSAADPRPRISAVRWAGAGVSVAGVWLVAGVSFSVSGSITGYLYMLGAALSWVAYCFLTRPLFARHSRIFIVFWQSVFGLLGFLPFAALEFPRWGSPDAGTILHVVFLGICCSALGYLLYAQSLAVLGAVVSTVFVNLIPVVTGIAGFFILGDRLTPLQWAGAALVIGGVTLAMLEIPTSRGKGKIRT
ncbi:DMT family transporter [Breznakiella homolactica]|uniref:DMT family transporter n=1 Tax=Breznakiella homolactica TaxID=2798577 RepID=A0A7T7XNP0_9SPIR|nr:DMT family transporter [Breznakiella homolactica]QQO09685.1 DMT family transporter [Breznakiella homolactica]